MDEKAHGKLADIVQFLSKTNNDEKSVPDEDKYYKDRYVQLKKLCEKFFNCLNAPFSKITDEEISSVLKECFGNNQARFENVVMSVDEFKSLLEKEKSPNEQDLVSFLSTIQGNCDGLLRKKKEIVSYEERSQSNQLAINEEYKQLIEVVNEQAKRAIELADKATKKTDELAEHTDEATKKADKATEKADKATEKANEAIENANIATENANKATEKANKATKQAEDLLTQILTVTGIFTAIIVAVVACYLSYILNRVDELKSGMTSSPFVNIARLGILACIVLLVAFFMVYLTAKMTGRSIACYSRKCPKQETKQETKQENTVEGITHCDKCGERESCCNLKRFWRRYPYIAAILGVLLIFSVVWILIA